MVTKTSTFAKNPAAWKARFALTRYLLIVLPLRVLFSLLERLHSGRHKDTVLFVAPYAELDENTRFLFEESR